MAKIREIISLVVLIAVYLLVSFRFYPGRMADSVQETLIHLLQLTPYTVGTTILLLSLFKRIQGQRPPWDRILRLYLTVGIIFEFFIGLYHYLEQGAG